MIKAYVDSGLDRGCLVIEGFGAKIVVYKERLTNNEGEFAVVLIALEALALADKLGSVLYTDSQFVVNQVRGYDNQGNTWKHCQDKFLPYRDRIRSILGQLPNIKLEWIPREKNLAGIELEEAKKNEV